MLQSVSQHAAKGPGQAARPRAQHDTASRSVLWLPQLPIILTERDGESEREYVCSCKQRWMIPYSCVFYLLQADVSPISTYFFECALMFSSAISQTLKSKATYHSVLTKPSISTSFHVFHHTGTSSWITNQAKLTSQDICITSYKFSWHNLINEKYVGKLLQWQGPLYAIFFICLYLLENILNKMFINIRVSIMNTPRMIFWEDHYTPKRGNTQTATTQPKVSLPTS